MSSAHSAAAPFLYAKAISSKQSFFFFFFFFFAEIENRGTSVYFAHPYSSWERPQNEFHNRSFRGNVPKGISIDRFTTEKILSFTDEMNDLPRKSLDYATAEGLFNEFLDRVYYHF